MDSAAGDEDGGGGVRGGGYELPRRGTEGESEGGVGFALGRVNTNSCKG
jgi:hypothetical protein